MKTKVSVIIPFLNEEENIPFLTDSIEKYFEDPKDFDTEILFINDGSTDNSLIKLRETKFKNVSAKVISLSRNFGSHAALRAGILHATGDYISFLYADLQDPLTLVDQLFEQCLKGVDICWATRQQTDNGWFEKAFSQTYAYMMKKYAVSSYPEKGFDIVMFSKKVQESLNKNIEANSSVFLQILTMGFRQTSIFYSKSARKKGKSKWTFSKKVKLFVDSFVAFSYAPIKLVTVIGILLFILGIVWSSFLILRKLVYNDLEAGWPALISILMIGFGITNISLGIIAEYLWRTLDNSRKRPVFIVDELILLNE